ncbi:hypothetical protein ACLQ8Z_05980 [Bordetella hinzii]|uniref:hypothetical protein n=1 Tax=Bordetella hinzii TaxID=103855 RepID=UPI0003FBBFAB|nr:hypothetical protein [Bordetella hinzii]AKQ55186.1 hypothetical protein ACR54_01866 [Bordetella hinzii]KCB28376.1 hypothetical protein L543_1406 [Bordetella hinzii L60]QWF39256.1 hypothetical protein HHA25_13660 [Bordetella hinzii]QWF43803.1 hypothetical protein HHA24_13655 [Bordetella hinzii]QWF48339.1 hypothetical protein HHA23_13655 [Bordetella hinzii]
MALDLALSSDHDLALDLLGRAAFIDGADRIAQQINVTLQVFLGEWFLDTSFGVPYFEEVLVKSPDRARIEAVLRSRILAVPGVQRVVSFDLAVERRERILRVTYQADTETGRVSRVLDLRSS